MFFLLILWTLFDFLLLGYRLTIVKFPWGSVHSVIELAQVRGVPTFLFRCGICFRLGFRTGFR